MASLEGNPGQQVVSGFPSAHFALVLKGFQGRSAVLKNSAIFVGRHFLDRIPLLCSKHQKVFWPRIRLKRSVFHCFSRNVRKFGIKKRGDFRTILEVTFGLSAAVWSSSRNHLFCRVKTNTCFSPLFRALYFSGLSWHSPTWRARQNTFYALFCRLK